MAYTRVNWEDGSASHNTPISAENLNKMDAGIKELDTNKANKSGGDFTGDISVNLSGDTSKPFVKTDYENGAVRINARGGYYIDYKIKKIVRTQTSNTYEYKYPDKSGTFLLVDDDNNIDLGNNTIESGVNFSVAEGASNILEDNWTSYCHVEGYHNTVYGSAGHAEGQNNAVTADNGHAEGRDNSAGGTASHAEGIETNASGVYSHAEGMNSVSSGQVSHAQNYYTVAGYNYQTAMGHYNNNKSTNLLEVGNGGNNNRSNAMEVTEDGDLLIKNGGVSLYGLDENKEVLGAKNLLNCLLSSGTFDGVTYSRSGKALILNGIVSTNSTVSMLDNNATGLSGASLMDLEPNRYIISIGSTVNVSIQLNLYQDNTAVTTVTKNFNDGDNQVFDLSSYTFNKAKVCMGLSGGSEFVNQSLYPMIRLATDPNPTYRPYAMSNQELTQRLLALEARLS